MQLYIVTWKFESSEDQNYSSEAFVDYVESGKSEDLIDGYERITWAHTPQDGTGVIICRASSASILFKVFGSWSCLLYTSPSPRDRQKSRMPSSA